MKDLLNNKVIEISAAFKTLNTCVHWAMHQKQCFSSGLFIRVSFADDMVYYNVCRGLLEKDIIEENFKISSENPKSQNIIEWGISNGALFDKFNEAMFKIDYQILNKIEQYKEKHYEVLSRNKGIEV